MQTTIPDEFKNMLRKMEREAGEPDSESLIAALDTPPSTGVRINTRKLSPDYPLYEGMEPVEWCPTGFRLSDRPLFTLNPLLHAGAFYVQDPSSMIYRAIVARICALLDKEQPGIKPVLLDFCAAPGGKTTAAIDALPDGSHVVANEFDPKRGKILRENLEKWGYPYIITTGDNSSSFSRLHEIFDIVAVDAPCSGEGMMRKEEEARRQWSPSLVQMCADLQREILFDIVNTLKPGGYLIYSTCTFNLIENEENAAFIQNDLGLIPIKPDIESGNASPGLMGDIPALRFMPHLTRGEGLFVCVFRKPENSSSSATGPLPTGHRTGKMKGRSGQKGNIPAFEYLPEGTVAIPTPEGLSALPKGMERLHQSLSQAGIRITGAGLPAAVCKGSTFIPDSRLVLSTLNKGIFPIVNLTEEEAVRYLRRESFSLPEGTPKGYVAVSFKDIPIGLMKNLGNRANNLFHAPWKIRIGTV